MGLPGRLTPDDELGLAVRMWTGRGHGGGADRMVLEEELTDVERRLLSAVNAGRPFELDTPVPVAATPGRENVGGRAVRAELLIDLLTDGERQRAVELRGVQITGCLDLECLTLCRGLGLSDCDFERPIILRHARASVIMFSGCRMPGIDADYLETDGELNLTGVTAPEGVSLRDARVGGHLVLNGASLGDGNRVALSLDFVTTRLGVYGQDGFTALGGVSLDHARVGGPVDFSGACLTSSDGAALSADGAVIDHGFFARDEFRAEGEVRLPGAHVGGELNFDGASLVNPDAVALEATQVVVNGSVLCRGGFTAEGEVRFVGTHIKANLHLDGASLINPKGNAFSGDAAVVEGDVHCCREFTTCGEVTLVNAQVRGDVDFVGSTLTNTSGPALRLQSMTAGRLFLLPSQPPTGGIDVTDARVTALLDHPTAWTEGVSLRGFVYEIFLDIWPVRARLHWLTLDKEGYNPQPYEQLAAAYRRAGRDEDARRVAIAKQRRRRHQLNVLGKAWNWLLFLTVGYGYRTWWAGGWLALLTLGGFVAFEWAYPEDVIAVSEPAPNFHSVGYTLDLLLPVADLGQQGAWAPEGPALYVSWLLIAAGWVLATAIVAGVTGVLKRS